MAFTVLRQVREHRPSMKNGPRSSGPSHSMERLSFKIILIFYYWISCFSSLQFCKLLWFLLLQVQLMHGSYTQVRGQIFPSFSSMSSTIMTFHCGKRLDVCMYLFLDIILHGSRIGMLATFVSRRCGRCPGIKS